MRHVYANGDILTTIEQDGEFSGEDLGRILRLRKYGYDWIGGFESIPERNAEFTRLSGLSSAEIDQVFENKAEEL
jgi:hypothetical protein